MTESAGKLKIGLRPEEWMPLDEYQSSSQLEKAVQSSRRYFQAILAEGNHGASYDRRLHSLWQMKGPTIAAIQRGLYESLSNSNGATPLTAAEMMKVAAEEARLLLDQVKRTRTNEIRLRNVTTMLEEVECFCGDAITQARAAKAAEISARAARWPESEPRGREARQWGECLAWGLDIIENTSGKPPQLDWWEITPSVLARHLLTVEDELDGRLDLDEVFTALRDHDIMKAWLAIRAYVDGRKSG